MTEPEAIALVAVPQPTDVARLVVTAVHDGYECTLFHAGRHHDVIASWYAWPDTGEDEWLDQADYRLDVARIVKTGHRADGHNRWWIQGGPFLGVTA